jgi:hypothetical protein
LPAKKKTGSIYPLLTEAQKEYVRKEYPSAAEIMDAFGIRRDEVIILKGHIMHGGGREGSFDPDTQDPDLNYEEEKTLEEQAEAGWKLTEEQKEGVRSSKQPGGVKYYKFKHLEEEQKKFIKDQRYTLAVLSHAFDAPLNTMFDWREKLLKKTASPNAAAP